MRSFADINAHAQQFDRKIYGIEPGNNGNRIIAQMIASDRFGLHDWTLVESSEQGMLSEVERAQRQHAWVVFLAWSPHPMNIKYHIDYLRGGDDTFGANYGGATIYTDVRRGYLQECPNVSALLRNLAFTPEIESQLMSLILDDRLEPGAAAERFLNLLGPRAGQKLFTLQTVAPRLQGPEGEPNGAARAVESCTRCGGQLKIIASIEEPQLIAKILSQLERAAPEQYQSELLLS